ncbi:hypothetical protein FB446DRAFT_175449 [Lentinula raphanica]|nr:hypothetical protein FB446DRAFT_175449 [Lentinula raphanica]KAJ3822538.1 hypothetical protein F5880DRAFT_663543 [Lentinula raphanica]
MSVISALTPGEILACMFTNSTGTFHWAVFVVVDHIRAHKFHAKQFATNHWAFEDPPPLHNLLESSSLSAMVKIGTIPLQNFDDSYNRMVALLREIPMTVPAHEIMIIHTNVFHCRVWFREAIRKLHDNGYIYCPNVWALYEECMGHARSNDVSLPYAQPRYFISRVSGSASITAGTQQGYAGYAANQGYGGSTANQTYGSHGGYYLGYGTGTGGSGGSSGYGGSGSYGGN